MKDIKGLQNEDKDELLEEITEAEYYRIIYSYVDLLDNTKYKLIKEVNAKITEYDRQITQIKRNLEKLKLYKQDHYIKYYYDHKKKDVVYKAIPKEKIGFKNE